MQPKIFKLRTRIYHATLHIDGELVNLGYFFAKDTAMKIIIKAAEGRKIRTITWGNFKHDTFGYIKRTYKRTDPIPKIYGQVEQLIVLGEIPKKHEKN